MKKSGILLLFLTYLLGYLKLIILQVLYALKTEGGRKELGKETDYY
jgi:hypothetical protein